MHVIRVSTAFEKVIHLIDDEAKAAKVSTKILLEKCNLSIYTCSSSNTFFSEILSTYITRLHRMNESKPVFIESLLRKLYIRIKDHPIHIFAFQNQFEQIP